jgi:hypothetical protein
MSRLFVLLGVALLAGCTAAPQQTPRSAQVAAPDTTNVTRKLQNHWSRCLQQSYQEARAKTSDKNAAAETAFQACASEEQDLASFTQTQIPHAPSPMPALRAGVKQQLIEEGRLPIYPEQ